MDVETPFKRTCNDCIRWLLIGTLALAPLGNFGCGVNAVREASRQEANTGDGFMDEVMLEEAEPYDARDRFYGVPSEESVPSANYMYEAAQEQNGQVPASAPVQSSFGEEMEEAEAYDSYSEDDLEHVQMQVESERLSERQSVAAPSPSARPASRTSGDGTGLPVDESLIPAEDINESDGRIPPQSEPQEPASGESSSSELAKNKEEKKAGKKTDTKTWRRAEATPNASRLMIGEEEELPLEAMQVHVQVDGFRARVMMDFQFFNDRQQGFEGTFKLRLPDEASPYFFAFGETAYKSPDTPPQNPVFFRIEEDEQWGTDPETMMQQRAETWQEPKEARMVPKDKASHAYRETVRRRVDPALMEWSGAGVFQARVFPIAAQKMHRIVIGYDVDLLALGDDLQYQLDLPANLPESMIDLNVATPSGVKASIQPKVEKITADGRTYFHLENPKQRRITLRLKDAGSPVLAGSEKETGDYFATWVTPQLPDSGKETKDAAASRGVFLIDTSLSSNPDRFNIWLNLLESMLVENRDTMKEFAVLFFNVETQWWQRKFVPNDEQHTKELLQAARKLALEGATDLGSALTEATQPNWLRDSKEKHDLFLLSDGAITWGQDDLHALTTALQSPNAGPLFSYHTGLMGTDSRVLKHLTRESGGAIFSVVNESQVKSAATAHRQRPWQLDQVTIKGSKDLLVAGQVKTLFPGQRLLLVGRGDLTKEKTSNREVVLNLHRGDQRETLKIPFHEIIESDLAPRVYGQIAVMQLESLKSATEEIARAYACHFRVTGQTSSLLMLESEADYERFDIKPQEDAFVVKAQLADSTMKQAFDQYGEQLASAKADLFAFLDRLEAMPGATFEVPTSLQIMLENLPESSFQVSMDSLKPELRHWDQIPGNYQELLGTQSMSYDQVQNEAERRMKKGTSHDALKALSSLVEQNPGDMILLRDVGFSAMQWGLGSQAYHLFRRVAASRPYEPQTYWAMAQCLREAGHHDLALVFYEIGYQGQWDGRFGEFRRILAIDYLHFLRTVHRGEAEVSAPEFAEARLASLSKEFPLERADLLFTIAWNTDGTDVDMHIYEPNGEHCYYSHRQTKIGGYLTQDVTQGYGPEMYQLPNAMPGPYRVKVKYFASDQNRASARTKVFAMVYENWGTPEENAIRKVVSLEYGKEMHDIATVVKKRGK
ncbi:VIT domain-containing protein [Planctomycetales bacterium 10988]|nr:VIT domain-containing protein [Planctomycetales bacterium 10988]